MIIEESELGKYLGKNLDDLEGKVNKTVFEKLKELDVDCRNKFNYSAIDYLFLHHQQNGKSIRKLSEEVGISGGTLTKVFDFYELPKLSRAEAVRQAWQDTGFREKHAEALRQELHQRWQDTGFREKQAEATRQALHQRWQDPEFRRRNAEAVRQVWQDPEFRRRNAEAVRQTRLNPENIGRYFIPTIYGERKDIGFAQSMWEANFARVLIYYGREFSTQEKFRLKVTKEFREIFNSDETDMAIDFVVSDRRGNIKLYDIMAHPFENPIGHAKLEMLIEQYPNINLKIIDMAFYNRLQRRFQNRVDVNPNLAGWETYKDNLRTNPAKYS